jgi:hypothetical protein
LGRAVALLHRQQDHKTPADRAYHPPVDGNLACGDTLK